MRTASVEIYTSTFNEPVKYTILDGTLEDITSKIVKINPRLYSLDVKKALLEGAWSDDIIWVGNHTLGIKVTEVSDAGVY